MLKTVEQLTAELKATWDAAAAAETAVRRQYWADRKPAAGADVRQAADVSYVAYRRYADFLGLLNGNLTLEDDLTAAHRVEFAAYLPA